MVNIKEKTLEAIQWLRDSDNHFLGISLEIETDREDDWDESYALFYVDIIDFEIIGSRPECLEFNESEFWGEFECWLSTYFDNVAEIKHQSDTGKIEIYYAKIMDEKL